MRETGFRIAVQFLQCGTKESGPTVGLDEILVPAAVCPPVKWIASVLQQTDWRPSKQRLGRGPRRLRVLHRRGSGEDRPEAPATRPKAEPNLAGCPVKHRDLSRL